MCRFSWCCCTFISSEAPSSLCLSLPFLVFGLKSNILTLLFAYLACLGHVFYNKSAAIGCCTFAIISICHIRPSRTPSSLCLSLPFLVFGLKSNILTLLFAYLACLGHVFYNKSAAIGCCTFAIISICHIRPSRTPSSFFRPTAHYLTAQSKHCRRSVRTPMPFRRRRLVPERLSL